MILDIIEVSQKQAYIFSSNRLRDNVERSAQIAKVTSSDFFSSVCGNEYDESRNLVYSGGGHTVLQFEDKKAAVSFNKKVTKAIFETFHEMEVFVKLHEYDGDKTPYENLKKLIAELEIKKSMRQASFKKGSYGIEAIDSNSRQPQRIEEDDPPARISDSEKKYIPDGYDPVYEISDLGDSYAAIVHIDGNGMGKRVNDFQKEKGGKGSDWPSFAKSLKEFSQNVDGDFKEAFRQMNIRVAKELKNGNLDALELKGRAFPIRRIISSGDDICFVCAGSIGLECARIFIEELGKRTNASDGHTYSACAGVSIVHSKYPFFRAYELAENLCSNAKSLGASLSGDDNGASVSAIDWHIEYGEIGDNLSDIRDVYRNEEGKYLYLRPYIVSASKEVINKEPARQYQNFKKVMKVLTNKGAGYARGSIKELRSVLRKKEDDAWYYLKYHKIESIAMKCYQGIYEDIDYKKVLSGQGLDKKLFVKTADGSFRSVMFDAVEIMDEFIGLD